jgi:hypothetical protein
MKDNEGTHTVVVDIPKEAFDMLPEVPAVQNITDDVMEVWNNVQTEELTNNFIQDVEKMLAKGEEE